MCRCASIRLIPEALAAALSIYTGKALVNSCNGEERSLNAVLPVVKEYGAAVIGLCMDDDGIPETAEARLRVAGKIIERAGKLGIPVADVVIDPLALTMGADAAAGKLALDSIELIVKEFGVNITMGASNISFGMPDRALINSTFIAMAIHAGLTCPITNPLVPAVTNAILAADLHGQRLRSACAGSRNIASDRRRPSRLPDDDWHRRISITDDRSIRWHSLTHKEPTRSSGKESSRRR